MKKLNKILLSAASSLVLGLLSTNSTMAGVIAVDSTLQVQATAGGHTLPQVITSDSDSQAGSINNLGLISTTANSAMLSTSASAEASWSSAAEGQVNFYDVGWDNGAYANTSLNSVDGTQWSYTFIADKTGQFTLDWLLSPGANNFVFNSASFYFSLSGYGNTGFSEILTLNQGAGISTRNIFAGNEYTAQIETFTGIIGGVGGKQFFMDGQFNWSMDTNQSAPEPGALILLSTAFLGLGLGRRKYQRHSKN